MTERPASVSNSGILEKLCNTDCLSNGYSNDVKQTSDGPAKPSGFNLFIDQNHKNSIKNLFKTAATKLSKVVTTHSNTQQVDRNSVLHDVSEKNHTETTFDSKCTKTNAETTSSANINDKRISSVTVSASNKLDEDKNVKTGTPAVIKTKNDEMMEVTIAKDSESEDKKGVISKTHGGKKSPEKYSSNLDFDADILGQAIDDFFNDDYERGSRSSSILSDGVEELGTSNLGAKKAEASLADISKSRACVDTNVSNQTSCTKEIKSGYNNIEQNTDYLKEEDVVTQQIENTVFNQIESSTSGTNKKDHDNIQTNNLDSYHENTIQLKNSNSHDSDGQSNEYTDKAHESINSCLNVSNTDTSNVKNGERSILSIYNYELGMQSLQTSNSNTCNSAKRKSNTYVRTLSPTVPTARDLITSERVANPINILDQSIPAKANVQFETQMNDIPPSVIECLSSITTHVENSSSNDINSNHLNTENNIHSAQSKEPLNNTKKLKHFENQQLADDNIDLLCINVLKNDVFNSPADKKTSMKNETTTGSTLNSDISKRIGNTIETSTTDDITNVNSESHVQNCKSNVINYERTVNAIPLSLADNTPFLTSQIKCKSDPVALKNHVDSSHESKTEKINNISYTTHCDDSDTHLSSSSELSSNIQHTCIKTDELSENTSTTECMKTESQSRLATDVCELTAPSLKDEQTDKESEICTRKVENSEDAITLKRKIESPCQALNSSKELPKQNMVKKFKSWKSRLNTDCKDSKNTKNMVVEESVSISGSYPVNNHCDTKKNTSFIEEMAKEVDVLRNALLLAHEEIEKEKDSKSEATSFPVLPKTSHESGVIPTSNEGDTTKITEESTVDKKDKTRNVTVIEEPQRKTRKRRRKLHTASIAKKRILKSISGSPNIFNAHITDSHTKKRRKLPIGLVTPEKNKVDENLQCVYTPSRCHRSIGVATGDLTVLTDEQWTTITKNKLTDVLRPQCQTLVKSLTKRLHDLEKKFDRESNSIAKFQEDLSNIDKKIPKKAILVDATAQTTAKLRITTAQPPKTQTTTTINYPVSSGLVTKTVAPLVALAVHSAAQPIPTRVQHVTPVAKAQNPTPTAVTSYMPRLIRAPASHPPPPYTNAPQPTRMVLQPFFNQTRSANPVTVYVNKPMPNLVAQSTTSKVSQLTASLLAKPLPATKIIDLTADENAALSILIPASKSTSSTNQCIVLTSVSNISANSLTSKGVPPNQVIYTSVHPTSQSKTTTITSTTKVVTSVSSATVAKPVSLVVHKQNTPKHPAELPPIPKQAAVVNNKVVPSKPILSITKSNTGIVLSWTLSTSPAQSDISTFRIYAYQETTQPPNQNLWKMVGDVKSMPLPMACTLSQFQEGHKYHFSVQPVDVHQRLGPFSAPVTITLLAEV